MKKILVLILIVVLLLGCLSPVAQGLVNLSFVAVNDTIPLTLSASEQPFFSGNLLYVPHTAFTASGLECYLSYNSGDATLALYNRSQRLEFNINDRTAIDENANIYPMATIAKNGYIYLPVAFCAAHFDMSVSYLTSSDGYVVVRFTNGNEIYDNSLFIQRAENFIAYKVEEASPTVVPTTPTVTEPTVVEEPEPEPEPEPEIIPATIYLGILGGKNLELNMTTLARTGQISTFFLTEEEILANGDMLRQMAASGHHLGIYGNDLEEIQAANQAYLAISLPKSLLVLTDFDADTEGFAQSYALFTRPEVETTATEAATQYETTFCYFAQGDQLIATLGAFAEEEVELNVLRETTHVESLEILEEEEPPS